MSSSAFSARIMKEQKMFTFNPPPGVCIYPVDDSIFDYKAEIVGPDDSPYEGGTFELDLSVTDRYPFEPPKLRFVTPIYHPNIDSTGRICLDLLKMPPSGNWQPSINLSVLLTSLRLLMSTPNPLDPLMVDISEEYLKNNYLFLKKAKNQTKLHAMKVKSIKRRHEEIEETEKVGIDDHQNKEQKIDKEESDSSEAKIFMISLFSYCARPDRKTEDSQSIELELQEIFNTTIYDIVSEDNRKSLWIQYLNLDTETYVLQKCCIRYKGVKSVVFGESSIDYSIYPSFGSQFAVDLMSTLQTTKMEECVRILICVHQLNDISYCPMLFPMIILFQLYFTEAEIYYILTYILENSSMREKYCVSSVTYLHALLNSLSISEQDHDTIIHTLSTFRFDISSFEDVVSVLDGFIEEGILFIIFLDTDAVGALRKAKQERMYWNTTKEMIENEIKHEKEEEIQKFRYFKGIPRSQLLTADIHNSFLPYIPTGLCQQSMNLLFTSFEDGYRLTHLLSHTNHSAPTLLLLQTDEGMIALYREDEWVNRNDSEGLINSILLYRDNMTKTVRCWKGMNPTDETTRFVYIRSTNEYLLVGAGGKDGISLYVPNDFLKSYSQKSDVFDNPPLCSTPFFHIHNMELFSMYRVFYNKQGVYIVELPFFRK